MKKLLFLTLASAALLTSCTDKGWSVEGKVDNAPDGSKMAIEGLNAGIWYNIDSVEVAADGTFRYNSPQGSPYPDIYRVSLDGRCIYFPIDSLDHITITADAKDFDHNYTLAGSDVAVELMNVDKKIADFVAANGVDKALTDSVFKRQISETINNDNSGVLSYYLINKTLGDRALYDETNRGDVRVLGAIANKFETLFPTDPRTQYLRQRYLKARSMLGETTKRVMEARETGLIDMTFYDAKGQKRKLSDVAADAGVTLLSFTSYDIDPSIAYNVELNRLYELFKGNKIAIYQVAISDDEVHWRGSAQNLPWVAVRCGSDQADGILNFYNVSVLPTTFVIDGNSDLVERIEGDPAAIEAAVRKHL